MSEKTAKLNLGKKKPAKLNLGKKIGKGKQLTFQNTYSIRSAPLMFAVLLEIA